MFWSLETTIHQKVWLLLTADSDSPRQAVYSISLNGLRVHNTVKTWWTSFFLFSQHIDPKNDTGLRVLAGFKAPRAL